MSRLLRMFAIIGVFLGMCAAVGAASLLGVWLFDHPLGAFLPTAIAGLVVAWLVAK